MQAAAIVKRRPGSAESRATQSTVDGKQNRMIKESNQPASEAARQSSRMVLSAKSWKAVVCSGLEPWTQALHKNETPTILRIDSDAGSVCLTTKHFEEQIAEVEETKSCDIDMDHIDDNIYDFGSALESNITQLVSTETAADESEDDLYCYQWEETCGGQSLSYYDEPRLWRAERRYKQTHAQSYYERAKIPKLAASRKPDPNWKEAVQAWKTVQRQQSPPTHLSSSGVRATNESQHSRSAGRHTLVLGARCVHAAIGQADEQEAFLHYLEQLQYREVTPEDFERLMELDTANQRKTSNPGKVDNLPRWMPESNTNVEEYCTICMCSLTDPDADAVVLPCGHPFHRPCISSWLLEHANYCPVDRSPL